MKIFRTLAAIGLSSVALLSIGMSPTIAAPAPATGDTVTNGRLGVSMEIRNMSTIETITVKDRDTGDTRSLTPGTKSTFSEDFVTAADELELRTWMRGDGEDIDAANPTFGWPNVTIDDDNENYAERETRYFVSTSGTKYQVHRGDDDSRFKRFFVEVTPGNDF